MEDVVDVVDTDPDTQAVVVESLKVVQRLGSAQDLTQLVADVVVANAAAKMVSHYVRPFKITISSKIILEKLRLLLNIFKQLISYNYIIITLNYKNYKETFINVNLF